MVTMRKQTNGFIHGCILRIINPIIHLAHCQEVAKARSEREQKDEWKRQERLAVINERVKLGGLYEQKIDWV